MKPLSPRLFVFVLALLPSLAIAQEQVDQLQPSRTQKISLEKKIAPGAERSPDDSSAAKETKEEESAHAGKENETLPTSKPSLEISSELSPDHVGEFNLTPTITPASSASSKPAEEVTEPLRPIASDTKIPKCEKRSPPQVNEVPDVASLKTPVSPAFIALGLAPAEIQRPTTPTGLKAAVAAGFSGKDAAKLMQNFAIEFSPYWLFPHPELSYEGVQNEKGWYFLRNISISLAGGPEEIERTVVDDDTGAATSEQVNYGRAALGVRTTLFPGWPSSGAKKCEEFIKSYLEDDALKISLAQQEFLATWESNNPQPQSSIASPDAGEFPNEDEFQAAFSEYQRLRAESDAAHDIWWKKKQEALAEFRTSLSQPAKDGTFDRCMVDIHARTGFMAEVAGASSLELPEGKLRDRENGGRFKNSAWVTAGYSFETLFGQQLETSLLTAYRFQRQKGSPTENDLSIQRHDFGARLAFAARRVGFAVEGTYRRQSDRKTEKDENLYRAALSLDYHLSGGMWLTGTFGKDFGDLEKEDPLIALANLQWNFGVDRGIEVDRKVSRD